MCTEIKKGLAIVSNTRVTGHLPVDSTDIKKRIGLKCMMPIVIINIQVIIIVLVSSKLFSISEDSAVIYFSI